MTFLQLCQRLVLESGIADSGPASVENQTGDMARMVNWINDAWVELQSRRTDWGWMWGLYSGVLSIGGTTMTLPDYVETVSRVVVDGSRLSEMDYDDFAVTYSGFNPGRPSVYTVRPDGVIAWNAEVDDTYSITFDYYRKPAKFSSGSDSPGMPERYHMAIVYRALKEYAQFDEAPELERKAMVNYEQMLADLARDQRPRVELPGAIA